MGWRYRLSELAAAIGSPAPLTDGVFERVSTDTRTLQAGDVFFAMPGDRFDSQAYVPDAFAKGAVAAVALRPHAAGTCMVVRDPRQALQDFAAFHRSRTTAKIVAITGSCGKTSSKDFASAVLETKYRVVKTKGNLNNEIGCPLSLLQMDAETDMGVLEMGANHKGEIASLCRMARPDESAITLIAPAHLEGFGSIEDVAIAKGEIVRGLAAEGVFYVNADDPRCLRIADEFGGTNIFYGSRGDVALEECSFDERGEMHLTIDPIGELRLPLYARAHAANVLLAVAIGLRHGVREFEDPLRAVCAAPSRFKVSRIGGIEIIDDTYNANPASVRAALQALADRPTAGARIAVLGDMLELGQEAGKLHRECGAFAGTLGIDRLHALGAFSREVADAARVAGVGHAETADAHDAIGARLFESARPGDVILVKGSRGMKMESVIESLRKRCAEAGMVT